LPCSFWLADNYVLLGRRDDALRLFERLLGLRNDVGLLAEEYDSGLKRQVGNFPQAFSHIALLSTAFNLGHGQRQNVPRPADQRGKDGLATPDRREPPH
jgi:GH15 family glucan-1,4-alpha-glucosidase